MQNRVPQRGAVLVESTLVTSLTLLIALGGLSVASIGYARVSSDAAAFYAARVYSQAVSVPSLDAYITPASASSSSAIANKLVAQLIPGVYPATMQQVAIQNAGMGTVVDKSYFTQSSRHGGVSIVVPEAQQALVNVQSNGVYGIPSTMTINGVDMEPTMEIVDPDFDITADSTYSANSGTAKYFGTAMDQPPYYLSRSYVKYCQSGNSWSGYCNMNWEFDSYGMAEYLNSTNISQPNASILMGNPSNPNVFAAMLCHQRVYSYIAQNFFPYANVYPNLPARYVYTKTANDPYNETQPMPLGATWQQQPFKFLYKWDAYIPNGYQVAAGAQVGTMPLNPLNGCDQVNASF